MQKKLMYIVGYGEESINLTSDATTKGNYNKFILLSYQGFKRISPEKVDYQKHFTYGLSIWLIKDKLEVRIFVINSNTTKIVMNKEYKEVIYPFVSNKKIKENEK